MLLRWRKTVLGSIAALTDARVPLRLKLLVAGGVLLVLSPLNILGDIPLLGMVDDAGLLLLLLSWFTRASSPFVMTIDA